MRSKSEIDKYLFKHRYGYLFTATVLQVFLISFFPENSNLLINELTFSFFILASINLIRKSTGIIPFMILFALISILLVWVPDGSNLGNTLFSYERVIVMLFLSVIIYQIFRQILRSKKVGTDVIFGALTIYILFGMLAGETNQLIYFLNNDAFTGNLSEFPKSDLRYYSFVTMTTLGYGDIAPVSSLARAVSVFYSLAGQLYLAVIIALIVGKYVSHSDKPLQDL